MTINTSFASIVGSFANFFKDQNEVIPSLQFKKMSDLFRISELLSNIEITNNGDVDEIFDNVASQIIEKANDPEKTSILNELNNISMSFANELENAFNIITNEVDPIVEDLKSKIKDRYVFNIKKEGAEEILEDTEDKTPILDDYVFLSWTGINSQNDIDDTISAATTNVGLNKQEISKFNLGIITTKSAFIGDFEDTTLTEEAKKNAIDVLVKRFGSVSSTLNDNSLKQFINILTSSDQYSAFCKMNINKMKQQKLAVQNCIEFLNLSNNFDTLANAIRKDTAGLDSVLTQATIDKILNNIEVLRKTMYAYKYYCLYQKTVTFNGKLILSSNVINSPEYNTFVNEGHSLEDIYNFIKAMYDQRDLPMNGINTSTVLTEKIDDRLSKINKAKEMNASYIKNKSMISAFNVVCFDYIKDIVNDHVEDADSDDVKKTLSEYHAKMNHFSSKLRGKPENLDDALYEFVIHLKYEDTLIYTLYRQLGSEYINMSKNKENIDEMDIFSANTKVSIDIILDYLINRSCE